MEQQTKPTEMWSESFFPTQIFQAYHPDPDSLDLASKILALEKTEKSIQKTNVGGWHSKADLNHREEFSEITNWFRMQMHKVAKQLYLKDEIYFQLDNMWANVNRKGHYNNSHVHPYVDYSGVYYVKAPSEKSKIWFRDPRPVPNMYPMHYDHNKKIPPHLWHNVNFTPTEGKILLFPSWLEHHVDPNDTDDERIAISFNFYQQRR